MNPTPKRKWYFHPLMLILISILSPAIGIIFIFEAPINPYWKTFWLVLMLIHLILRVNLFLAPPYH